METENRAWQRALACLPERLRRAAERTGGDGGGISEIRIRAGGLCCLTADGGNLSCEVSATKEETAETVRLLCGGSLYAHADEIREGVVSAEGGIRAGVAGVAVTEDGRVRSLRDISSVCIRLPKRRPGAASAVLPLAAAGKSVLVWSAPGMGKTTLLRELIASLASAPYCRRLAVIDTRFELGAGLGTDLTADFYRGWPRGAGMEAAVRAMSPEILVCDELTGEGDAAAVRAVRGSGTAAVCSVHGGDFRTVLAHPLVREGLFDVLCGILPLSGTGGEEREEDGRVRVAVSGGRRIEVRRLA